MRIRPSSLLTATATAGLLVVTGAGPALAVCDAYSGTCTEPPGVLSTTGGSASVTRDAGTTPASLPFTGGEVVLLALAGAGAVAGGIALTAAGRRRSDTV